MSSTVLTAPLYHRQAEFLSLVYPRTLTGRLRPYGAALGAESELAFHEPAPRLIDSSLVRQLLAVISKLESVASAMAGNPPLCKTSSLALTLRDAASDEDLFAVVEHVVIRLETTVAALQFYSLGPLADVLSALGDAIKVDPKTLLHALQAFGAATIAAETVS